MKIILATPIYPPEIGGPATYVKELAERLKDKHDLTIVAYTDVREPIPGTTLVRVSKDRPLPIRLFRYFVALWKIAPGSDLIYVQNAMASGFPVFLVSLLRGIPYIVKFVGDEAWERATQNRLTDKSWEDFLIAPEGGSRIKLMQIVQKFVLKRATIVTTPSIYLINELKKSYDVRPERTLVNYNAAEPTPVLPFTPHPNPLQIITTARLIALKKIDGLIEAFAIVKKNYPKARLVIGGDGPELDSLKTLRDKLGLNEDVTFLGKISRAETWQLRKNSGVYVINSTHEGLPITVLTSLAAGIPTVATNIPGVDEVVYNEKTGLLVEPGNTKALAEAIERLFEDRGLREKIIKNGYKLLEDKFSWSAHLKTVESMFDKTSRHGVR